MGDALLLSAALRFFTLRGGDSSVEATPPLLPSDIDCVYCIPPTAVPPGIGIPVNVITRIVKSLEKAVKLIASLSVITAIAITILESEVAKLNDLIERLKAINQLLNDKTVLNLNEQQFNDLSSAVYNNVDDINISDKEIT
jgi:hypothetical protein